MGGTAKNLAERGEIEGKGESYLSLVLGHTEIFLAVCWERYA